MKKAIMILATVAAIGIGASCTTAPALGAGATCFNSTIDPGNDILMVGPINTVDNAESRTHAGGPPENLNPPHCEASASSTLTASDSIANCPVGNSPYDMVTGGYNTPAGYQMCF